VGTLTGKYKHSKLKTVYANKTELMFTAQWNFAILCLAVLEEHRLVTQTHVTCLCTSLAPCGKKDMQLFAKCTKKVYQINTRIFKIKLQRDLKSRNLTTVETRRMWRGDLIEVGLFRILKGYENRYFLVQSPRSFLEIK